MRDTFIHQKIKPFSREPQNYYIRLIITGQRKKEREEKKYIN